MIKLAYWTGLALATTGAVLTIVTGESVWMWATILTSGLLWAATLRYTRGR